MKENVCSLCSSRKGRRNCKRFNGLICSKCCGSIRNIKDCPIDCNYIELDIPEPKIMIKESTITSWEEGDIFSHLDFIFIPTLYQYITFKLLDFDLFYENSQTLQLSIEFLLKKEFNTDTDKILCKESWKEMNYLSTDDDKLLYPLIGIANPVNGLFSITPENIKLEPSKKFKGSVTHWIMVPHDQRGLDIFNKFTSTVKFIASRNLFIFSELLFDVPYNLKMKVYGTNTFVKENNLLNTIIGLLIPFGKISLINPFITSPPGFSLPSVSYETYLPSTFQNYPGETFGQYTSVPCRGNEHIIYGKQLKKVNNMINGPLLHILEIFHKISSDMIISILTHDRFINPSLIHIFKQFYGDITFPIHINVINLGIYKRLLVKYTDQNTGSTWIDTFAAPTKSEINVPIFIPRIYSLTPGILPINVEISYAGDIIHTADVEIEILPPKDLLTRIHDIGHDWYRDTLEAIACWVTPHNNEIEKLISDTKDRLGVDFFNSNKPVVAQIKALWDELKIRKIIYDIDSLSVGTSLRATYQHIRTPETTLKLNKGNCLDITLVFASALEKLSLDPSIILINEHAFLGCKIDDTHSLFLETTCIEYQTFGYALKAGQKNFENDGWKRELKISELRSKGFEPLFS